MTGGPPSPPPKFGEPPQVYDVEWFRRQQRDLNSISSILRTPSFIFGTALNLTNLGTASTESEVLGLRVGDVYVDGNGFLKIAREGEGFAASAGVSVACGSVTVTTT